LQHLAFFNLYLPAKFNFAGTVHLVAASQDALLYPQEVGTPCRDPEGPYEDSSLLQHLVFFYLDPSVKFCFAGTVYSVDALQNAFLHPPKSDLA
jgi:hypothetical protein